MNKALKSILLVVIILSLTVLIPTFMDSMDLFGTKANAEDAGWSEVVLTGDPESVPVGTTTDPFIVLEIVTHKAIGEIGYLVGGEEPVDEALFKKNDAAGNLSFLGGAITPYNSYVEKPIASTDSNAIDKDWKPRITFETQSGYYKYVGRNNGGLYQPVTGQDVYTRVADGEGNFTAKLDTENTSIYDEETWLTTNQKNVNAYFKYGTLDSNAPTTAGYTPCSVTRIEGNKGDYDYNSEKKAFILNKGKGEYDVVFKRSTSTTNLYYMTADYKIVDNFTGDYSWSLTYVSTTNGNYIKETNGMIFNKNTNDQWNYTYIWVQAENEALSKPSNFYVENPGTNSEKIWVKGQKIEKYYEFNFNVTLVNNEWFKRLTLGIAAEDCKNFKVEVITMTPSELNQTENQALLSRANMFYINDNYGHNGTYMDLYETKNQDVINYLKDHPEKKFDNVKANLSFAVDDLNWEGILKLFNRVAGVKSDGSLGGYRAAIIFDYKFYTNATSGTGTYANPYKKNVTVSFTYNSDKGATVCNLAKLFIMVYQRDPVDFFNLFLKAGAPLHIDSVASTYNSTGTTGSFKRPDSTTTGEAATIEYTYWNGNTFCPYMLDANGNVITPIFWTDEGKKLLNAEIPNFNITATPTDIMANVLILDGQDIFTSKYLAALDKLPADALEIVQIYVASHKGGVVPSNVSISNCIQLISNSGTGYGNNSGSTGSTGEDGTSGSNLRTYTSVLNIEPTASFTTSESNIRSMLEGYNLRITNMTSAEFNSSILDVNTHYDMIYIGGGIGRFNRTVLKDSKGKDVKDSSGNLVYTTVFNNDLLNGSTYNRGDKIITSQGTMNYVGNDITTGKKTELQKFLSAGFPIVFENSVYTLSSVVKSDTNLYSFIQAAKGTTPPSNVLNYANYVNTSTQKQFIANLVSAFEIVRPMIRIIQPTLSTDSKFNYLYVDTTTKKLNIEFAILPKGLTANNAIKYNAYLYMDYNEDGIFSETEKLNAVPTDGSSSRGLTESKFKAYLYSYDMSKYNGVYQWQVKVVRQYTNAAGVLQDTEIRSEITGYAACTNRQEIDILQITDNPQTDTTAYNIEDVVNNTSSSSLIRKYGGFGNVMIFDDVEAGKLKDYDLKFTTMSVEEFLQLYEAVPYPGSDAVATNKLANYHLLILDNQVDVINDDHGALTNIKSEITSGIGVIYTKGAINYNNQTSYLNTSLFENQRTYTRLSHIATPTTADPYYIFDFVNYGFTNIMMKNELTYHTNFITKSNEGADSQYPYIIGSSIKIAESSYVEDTTVDYNRSDTTPLIGWYSLSDSRSPQVRSAGLVTDTNANTYAGIYSSSPNDVKNNYYMFNRGKIYYCGIQLSKADVAGNDSEIKLFINTIISTYKTSGRVVAKAPVISILDPLPVDKVITLDKAYVGNKTEIPITFELTNSSSDMDLSILWNSASKTTGNWNKTIYKVSETGDLTQITNLNNIAKGKYLVNIPVTALSGNHTLTISATNEEGRTTTLDTTIKYSPNPITVTIDNSDLVKNVDKEEQYLYIDIDYGEINNEINYLKAAEDIRLEFTISNVPDKASILVTDADGNVISMDDSNIYTAGTVDGLPTYSLNANTVTNGSYYVNIPASNMNGVSSLDIKITAKSDTTNSGFTTVTLLRRSFFQLD
ncbi:MAG: DUF5057 domain-containing protein [Herbinix sp.]|nr:DUF5057 domain-containing protein [Herbinix sp.]